MKCYYFCQNVIYSYLVLIKMWSLEIVYSLPLCGVSLYCYQLLLLPFGFLSLFLPFITIYCVLFRLILFIFYVLQHTSLIFLQFYFARSVKTPIFAIRAYQKAPICELSVKKIICHKLLADSVFCLKMPAFSVHRS